MAMHDFPEGIKITFKDVGVTCNDLSILNQVNLTLAEQQFTGIIGASGSGKTSLIRCLTRTFPIMQGTMYINDIASEEMSTTDLRALFSVASQDAGLFSDTLLANLTYGAQDVEPKQLERVLEITHLSDLVNHLPNGLQTVLDQHHRLLSKGEIQRILIARALLRSAKVYVFDEPTSALDIKNEEEIMDGVIQYLQGKTVIVITHRLSILKHADQIVLMGKGTIQSIGSDLTAFNTHHFV